MSSCSTLTFCKVHHQFERCDQCLQGSCVLRSCTLWLSGPSGQGHLSGRDMGQPPLVSLLEQRLAQAFVLPGHAASRSLLWPQRCVMRSGASGWRWLLVCCFSCLVFGWEGSFLAPWPPFVWAAPVAAGGTKRCRHRAVPLLRVGGHGRGYRNDPRLLSV